jgi:ribosomal protein S18 acetylase RimI-like enzyme
MVYKVFSTMSEIRPIHSIMPNELSTSVHEASLSLGTRTPLYFEWVGPEAVDHVLPLLLYLAGDNQAQTPQPSGVIRERWLSGFQYNGYRCLLVSIEVTDRTHLTGSEKQAVGLCGAWATVRHYCGHSLELDHVIVDPVYRGKGIGEAMLNHLKTLAKYEGFDALELNHYRTNEDAGRFYERLGYQRPGYHCIQMLNKGTA